jgi:hypothetical protein
LQAITGLSFTFGEASQVLSYHCALIYSQATPIASDQFGVGLITTAGVLNGFGSVITTGGATAAQTTGVLTGLNTVTPTAVVTFTPVGTGNLQATLDGTFTTGAGASTFNIYVANGTAADVIVIARGSYCALY